ncbi:MAG: hypothetical protein OEY63_08845 [Gemmatimonadota bacterium]|nr:hypothetical protein [Gemmatimonadota bacterium]MDH5805334.1 hypothetical protein [Gemmatimonadota bacterium]
MADKKNRPERTDSTGAEVDRLLRKLPGSGQEKVQVIGPNQPGGAGGGSNKKKDVPQSEKKDSVDPATIPTEHRVLLWGLLLLCLVGVGLFELWPWDNQCGWRLYGFLAALSVFVVITGWCILAAFKQRGPISHTVAIILAFYGIVMIAHEVLPRTGYAKYGATWQCNE